MNSDSRSSISFDENRRKTSKIFARNESIDSGTLSASASFHSKDTYSKETYTDNYDSSESESKSTLSNKQDSTSRVNSISTFLFFNKGSFTDHSDSSDSLAPPPTELRSESPPGNYDLQRVFYEIQLLFSIL